MTPSPGKPPSKRTFRRPVEDYFARVGWKPFPFQRSVWAAHLRGESGLVHSATGTGKTLAVWLGPLLQWMRENPDPTNWSSSVAPAARVLWVTPLRALAGDTEQALRGPLESLGLPWTLDRRTGDVKQSAKAKQLKRLPSALVTTPESLSLLLTHQRLHGQLAGLKCVVVDEWHELLGTKRGIQTELSLAALRRLAPELQTWGVSATLGNLDEALRSLAGTNADPDKTSIIQGYRRKGLKMQSVLPTRIDRFPWAGHIGTKMIPEVAQLIDRAASSLVFANTRSQTEIWYQQLLQHRPDWAGQIALHHGSLDASVRSWVEDGLRGGTLKSVVCTSSLDLGVDFTAVDLVIQIGSPKGAARLLQRAGRSGHQPDATSHLAFVPTNAIELAELAAARVAIKAGRLESKRLLDKPLDVLAQHLVTVAIGGGFTGSELLAEVRTTQAYESLTDDQWRWVTDFVVRGGSSLNAYPEFKRVSQLGDRFEVTDRRIASRHRMNIGTIVADAAMEVKYLTGGTLGTAEESFLSKLNENTKFLFAGRLLELVQIRDNIAYVRRAKGKPDAVPRWMGGRLELSSELAQQLRQQLELAADGNLVGPEMKRLRPLFQIQAGWSRLPRTDQLLVERVKTRQGWQMFCFPFEGRLVHEGLSAITAYRLSQLQSVTFSIACNDYGFVLQSAQPIDDLEARLRDGLLRPDGLIADIMNSMNATEMAKRQFRAIARVAGLIHQGYPGSRKSSRHIQASSNLFFDVFREYDPDNLLLRQSQNEVLQQQLDADRMHRALQRIESSQIIVTDPPKVTPLAFPLLVDKLRERISSETLATRIERLQAGLEKAAGP